MNEMVNTLWEQFGMLKNQQAMLLEENRFLQTRQEKLKDIDRHLENIQKRMDQMISDFGKQNEA